MVKSLLDKQVDYKEDYTIDNDDKGTEMSSYYHDINGKEIEIVLGNKRTQYSDSKNIIFMHIYQIVNDKVSKKIGIFEIKASEFIHSIDDDGDIILDNGNIIFFPKSLQEIIQEPPTPEGIPEPTQEPTIEIIPEPIKESKTQLIFDKVLEFEKKEVQEELSKQFHLSAANTWVEKAFQNHNFNIEEVSPNGDCFFLSIVKAYDGTGKHINVDMLRTYLSTQVTDDIFNTYYDIYNAIVNENQRLSYTMNEKKKQNKILKQRYENTLDKQDSLEIIKEGEILRSKFNDDKINSNGNSELLGEFKFMEGVTTIDEMKKVIKTSTFWADTWAISEIEKHLNIKTIILSKDAYNSGDITNIILCGQINDNNKVVREPDYYIMLSYTGNHYDLVTYSEKSLLTFRELPYIIRRGIVDKCIEKLSGPFYEINDFKKVRDKLNIIEDNDEDHEDDDTIDIMDCNNKVVFVVHAKSNNKPRPGKGTGESIETSENLNYNLLHNQKDWRRKLDDSWSQEFNIDGKKWLSVKHYVYGSRYKKGFPDFYHSFSLNSDSNISKDVDIAAAAVSKSGKYKNEVLRKEEIHVDNDFNESENRELALTSKFSQNSDLKYMLSLTKNACIKQYQRNIPLENDNVLMKVRGSIIVE
jgi:hypothetical protein